MSQSIEEKREETDSRDHCVETVSTDLFRRKKKVGTPGNLRRNRSLSSMNSSTSERKENEGGEDIESDEEDEDDTRPKLEDVRLIVKSRNRRRGLLITSADPSGEHSSSSLLTSKENLEDEDLRGFGLQKPKSKTADLGASFTNETNVDLTDELLEQYIEENMKKRGLIESNEDSKPYNPMEEVYVIPEHLRIQPKPVDESLNNFLSNIVEVEISSEDKLRNIEETEKARKGHLHLEKRRDPIARRYNLPNSVPDSSSSLHGGMGRRFDAPYSRHHHQHQHRHQSASSSGKFGVTAAPEKYTDNHKSSREPEMKRRRHERGPNSSTDDLAFEKFKRRMIHRMR